MENRLVSDSKVLGRGKGGGVAVSIKGKHKGCLWWNCSLTVLSGHMNLYMRSNCTELKATHTHKCMKNWRNLNEVCGFYQCQFPAVRLYDTYVR